ncbi:MAG: hypothetical protein RL885_21315 [Planctomycetota bacterium]
MFGNLLRRALIAGAMGILAACSSLPEWRVLVTERDDFEGVVQDTYEVMQESLRRTIRVDREEGEGIARLESDPVITSLSEEFDFARARVFAFVQARKPRGFRIEVLVLIEELEVGELTAAPLDENDPGVASIERVTGGKWVPAGRDEEYEEFLMTMLRHKLRSGSRKGAAQPTEEQAPPVDATGEDAPIDEDPSTEEDSQPSEPPIDGEPVGALHR